MATVAAFAFMFMGARTCDGYTIAAFSGMMPLLALVLSITILKESVTLQQLAGCALIITSILVMSGKSRRD